MSLSEKSCLLFRVATEVKWAQDLQVKEQQDKIRRPRILKWVTARVKKIIPRKTPLAADHQPIAASDQNVNYQYSYPPLVLMCKMQNG